MGGWFSSEPSKQDDESDEPDQGVERHYRLECDYITITGRPKFQWNPYQRRHMTATKVLRRVCKCATRESQEKAHFSELCKWDRYHLGVYDTEGYPVYELRENCWCRAISDPQLPYNEP
ncbi:hypothetical protein Bbelb_171820 [Branchiostoma belcheri]|nr:hypothetical protein Bbelb_171820 [Branchiostoma belcheri]